MSLFTRIRKHERGLRFRHGDFVELLGPGRHWTLSRLWSANRNVIDVASTLETKFTHPMQDALLNEPSLREAIEVIELTDNQRAIVWRDGRLFAFVGPGRHAFWKTPYALTIETFNIDSLRFEHEKLEAIVRHPESGQWLDVIEVDPHAEALLIVNGQLAGNLEAGKYVFWKNAKRVRVMPVDRREQTAEVAGQEIMTSDKVTLRVNLVVTYQVSDAAKAVTTVSDYGQSLYREAQLALRAAVGTRPIDALLADKESVGGEVKNALLARAAEFGVVVRSVGLRDIILPGDMKMILNQVITAQKEAEANLIRRREETAAARSQANTAKLLAENPLLARMKELEALGQMLAGAKTSFVFGQGDMLEHLRGLIRAPQEANEN